MRTFLLTSCLMVAAVLSGQSYYSLDANGQRKELILDRYEVEDGTLILYGADGSLLSLDGSQYPQVVLAPDLRFAYLEYADGKINKSGFFQQLASGRLQVYDLGDSGVLAKEPDSERLRLIPFNDNTPTLTFLFQECPTSNADYLEKVNTNGLKNLLSAIHEFNRCVDEASAKLLLREKATSAKFRFGLLGGVKVNSFINRTGSSSKETFLGYSATPTVGMAIRVELPRTPFQFRIQPLLTFTRVKKDRIPIPINNFTFQSFDLKFTNLQFNLAFAYQFRKEGFLNSAMIGLSPRINLSNEFSRESFGGFFFVESFTGMDAFGIGLMGGINLFDKQLSNGSQLSVQLQADTYQQTLLFTSDTEQKYYDLNLSLLGIYFL